MNKEINSNSENKGYVVGIGASAGGLEALQKLLTALPPNTGFPYIIVQHLSPDYKSLLSEILSKYTDMPVVQVEGGMEVKPDCVYVIQPGKNMRISKGKIQLSNQKERELNLPIDMFFRSLAEEFGPRAISIILSGTGSDGSNGIKAIKENDGLILVQDFETAKFDGMPRSAMRTGIVDAQLSPEKMALELMHISNAVHNGAKAFKTERQIDEELMKKIYIILKKISKINFTHYKQTTILRRIERRMMLTHKESLADYVDYLYANSDEVITLSKEVLIGVTNFFRDPEYFQILKEKAIQEIILHSSPEEAIRVWVAGCSTGEEAYSIAILFCEVMETLKIKRSVKVFATDLDVDAITTASKGTYGDSIIDSVSPSRLSRYFTRSNNAYVVNRELRKMVIFSPHNVFQDPPFGRIDLISCRNMMIYFQPVLQNDLFNIFHSALKDKGFLFLGKSEAIGAYTEAFPIIDASAKIFTHNASSKIVGSKAIPYLQTTYLDGEFTEDMDNEVTRRNVPVEVGNKEEALIDVALLESFMPACLVINSKNEVVHSYGESSNYIHLSAGRFSNILFDILTEQLKVPASTILKEARSKKQKVQYRDIHLEGEREAVLINLTAMPIGKKGYDQDDIYALVFSENKERGKIFEAVPYEIDKASSQRITDLEQELGEVQTRLDKSVAEQECVNEELQAANEELLTANEELQSSNEELQSVNEELYTVNSEYQQKLAELADLNDDIANFLSTTQIGIIFVDNKLNIRRYTNYVTTEFSVMDHDIGRSLKFISYHLPSVDISEICENVLKTLVPDEREVTTSKKKVFLMRVAPYRSMENKILGCVITLVDITMQKQGLVKLQSTEEQLSMLKQSSFAKNDYISKISHEIKTPMSALVGLTRLAKQNANNNNELMDYLDKITDTVDYMSSIVTDISNVAHGGEYEREQVMEPFALRDVVESVNIIIKQRAIESSITYESTMDDDFNPTLIGNTTAIKQILVNVLNNAIKYTPMGGSISLKTSIVDSEPDVSTISFIVSDTGKGISKDFIPELFKPFTRENYDDNSQSSMGLGLSIAYNLIQSMNGNISVESEVGAGTTFTIMIKLNKSDGKHGLKKNQDVHYDLSGSHVLIAEDNPLNRMILAALLKNENITFEEAENGAVAIEKFVNAKPHTFDCILMDMRMPNIDGIKATIAIRNSDKEDANTIPIIAVSANGFTNDIIQAEKAGISGYTLKPIDRAALLGLMNKLVKEKNK